MAVRMTESDLEGALQQAGLAPQLATAIEIAWADRFLQIYQGDPRMAGAALRLWLQNQQPNPRPAAPVKP